MMRDLPDGITYEDPESKKEIAILEDLKKVLKDSFVELSRAGEKTSETLIRNMVGPLQLITKPLEDLTGVDFVKPLTQLPGAIGSMFRRQNKEGEEDSATFLKKKVNPSKQELVKQGVIGAAAVHIADAIKDSGGPTDGLGDFKEGIVDDITKGLTEGLTGGVSGSGISALIKSAAPALMTAAGIGLIAGGIIWGVVDGIVAYGKAEEWGVSGIAAGLGGFFGGTGEGESIKDAFKNAGKFAILGAGIGLLAGGPLGALAGGLAGAAIGGILGWVGGENIAQFFQGVGDWFKETVGGVKEWLAENEEGIQAVKEGVLGVLGTVFGPIIDGVKSVFSGLTFRFRNINEIMGDDEMTFWQKAGAIGKEFVLGIIEIPYNFVKRGLASFFGDRWQTMSDIMGDEESTLWEKITGIGREVFSGIIDKIKDFAGGILSLGDSVIRLVLNDKWEEKYEEFKEVFSFIVTPIVEGVKEFFSGWVDRFHNIVDLFGDDELSLWEKIKGVAGELVGGYVDGLKSLLDGVIESVRNFFDVTLVGLDILVPRILGEAGEEKWESFKDSFKDWFGMILDPFMAGIQGFFTEWRDRLENISDVFGDEDLTLWEKVKDIGKELLSGIVEGPINLVKGWMDGLMGNEKFLETRGRITDWFDHIGDAVGNWIWGILPAWSRDALRKLGIGPAGEMTEAGAEVSSKVMKQVEKGEIDQAQIEGAANKEFIDNILKGLDIGFREKKLKELYDFEPSRKMLAQVGIDSLEDIDNLTIFGTDSYENKLNAFRELYAQTPVEQVKDAVIYKSGRMIEPSPDDNIVLTQATPNVLESKITRQLTSDINQEYFSERIMDESNKKFDRMIDLLQGVISAIQGQETGAVIQNISQGQYSLDGLRMGR